MNYFCNFFFIQSHSLVSPLSIVNSIPPVSYKKLHVSKIVSVLALLSIRYVYRRSFQEVELLGFLVSRTLQ